MSSSSNDFFKKCRKDVPMSRYTTFKVGGPADFFFIARSIKALKTAVEFACSKKLPFFILGGGSNILVCDCGIRALVIKNALKGIRLNKDGCTISVKSGEKLSRLLNFAAENNLGGLEFASGIPGTVGGAICGNAGAYGRSVGDVLTGALVMDRSGKIIRVNRDYFNFQYRFSSLKKTGNIVLEADLLLSARPCKDIRKEMDKIIEERRKKHPSCEWACAGSYFKNVDPPSPGGRRIAAGYLLEKVGAKGMKVGRATVFPGHANFITNPGGATAAEILKLADILKNLVKKEFDIELKEEVMWVAQDGILNPENA